MNGDVGMDHAKNSGNKKFPKQYSKYTSTIMYNPHYIYSGKGLRMIVLVYLIVLLRELLVSTIFCMVHPYIAIHSVE